jgi:hypothetical protein
MVEIHYEEQRGNEQTGALEKVHWRVIVNDATAALAQVAQDFADGRQPLSIVEHDDAQWDVSQPYNPKAWKNVVPSGQLRKRAMVIGPAF